MYTRREADNKSYRIEVAVQPNTVSKEVWKYVWDKVNLIEAVIQANHTPILKDCEEVARKEGYKQGQDDADDERVKNFMLCRKD